MEMKIDLKNLLLNGQRMDSFEDLVAHIIPPNWQGQDFEDLHKAYLRLKIKDDAFTDIGTYMDVNGIFSRKTIYNHIRKGKLKAIKRGKYIFIKNYND